MRLRTVLTGMGPTRVGLFRLVFRWMDEAGWELYSWTVDAFLVVKSLIYHPAKLCLHTCFLPETEIRMCFWGEGWWGDWSDSYISRMQGHPHHLVVLPGDGCSLLWTPAKVFRDPGQVPWPRAGWPDSEGGRDFRRQSGFSKALCHWRSPHSLLQPALTLLLATPGCTQHSCSCQVKFPASMPPLSTLPLCPPCSFPLLAVLTPTSFPDSLPGSSSWKASWIPFVLPQNAVLSLIPGLLTLDKWLAHSCPRLSKSLFYIASCVLTLIFTSL